MSLAMEGKFSGGGLQALDDGDDMLTAMARELVTQRGIGEPADAVWRQIQAEQNRMVPAVAHEPLQEPPSGPAGTRVPIPEPAAPFLDSLLTFGSRPSASRLAPRKKRTNLEPAQDQLALF